MLSIDEFQAAASAHTRRMIIAACVSTAGMFAIFGTGALYRPTLYGFLSSQWGVPVAEAFFVAGYVIAMLTFLGGMWTGYRRSNHDQRLLCPDCGTFLGDRLPVVVATRNCVQCGRRVLADPV